jgi:hypothetical protein
MKPLSKQKVVLDSTCEGTGIPQANFRFDIFEPFSLRSQVIVEIQIQLRDHSRSEMRVLLRVIDS